MIDPKTLKPGDKFVWHSSYSEDQARTVANVNHKEEVVTYRIGEEGLDYQCVFHHQDWQDAVLISALSSESKGKPKLNSDTFDILCSLHDDLSDCLTDATTLVTTLHLFGADEELEADRAEDCTFKTVRELKDIIGRLRRFKERAYGDKDGV